MPHRAIRRNRRERRHLQRCTSGSRSGEGPRLHIWKLEWGRGPAAHLIVGVGKGPGCTSGSWSGEGARLVIWKLGWGKGPGWSSVSWLWEKVEILVETQNWNSQPQNEFRATLKYAMSSFRDKSIRLSKNFGILTNGKRRLGVRRYVNS